MDCHTQWHHMHESYFDPDMFRLHLNSLLQNLRNVTFLLQKQKAKLVGYDTWYPQFQQEAKRNQIARWSVDSRNRVTKESDLDLLSTCQVTWALNWVNRVENAETFPPHMSTREIIDELRRRHIAPAGVVTVRRRWVDKELPEWELLDATAEAYSRLARLLWTVHSAAGVYGCDIEDRSIECVTSALSDNPSRLSCMHLASSDLQGHFSLTDNRVIEQIYESVEIDLERGRASAERIGGIGLPALDPISNVPGFMETARRVMNKDGYHDTLCFLYRGNEVAAMRKLQFNNQQEKMLSFEHVAELVESTRSDGVLVIGEMWVAVQTEKEKELGTVFFPARDRLDRMEALSVYAVTRDGRQAEQLCMVERGPNGEAQCEEPGPVEFNVLTNTALPIKRKWENMERRGL